MRVGQDVHGEIPSRIEFKRYVAGKMELERADKRFFPDKLKAMGDMVAREKNMMDFSGS